MKFSDIYKEYKQNQEKKKLSMVHLKNVLDRQNVLDRRRYQLANSHDNRSYNEELSQFSTCQVSEEVNNPRLVKEMLAMVELFNERGKRLVGQHQASGLSKCLIWFKNKLHGNHVSLFQQGKDLVIYAFTRAIALRKILNKFDKNDSTKKAQFQCMYNKIIHSPWLYELVALQINLRDSNVNSKNYTTVVFDGYSLTFNEESPSLVCELDSMKIETDLTCPICLDTLFDPVSLSCGHAFCYLCACKAASMSIVEGLKATSSDQKCPICRQEKVYKGAVRLKELHLLISRRCPRYWRQRKKMEKLERIQQIKDYWDSQARMFTGI